MATAARLRLVGAAALLLLWLVPWPAQAGTQEDPEFADDAGDPELQGFPFGLVPIVSEGVDLRAGWVDNETSDDFVLALQLEGEVEFLDPATSYQYDFHVTINGTESVATAVWSGGFAPGGVATAVAAEGSVIRLTVPKSALGGVFRGDTLDGLFAASSGTLVTDPLSSALDRAPDDGAGRPYTATAGFARGGSASDQDADGLPDAWETQHFGNITAHDGTTDPDADGLNNSAENRAGTDPVDPDTDGDGVDDGDDPFPLDATRPGGTGGATDSDGDGLNDTWEREHFNGTAAQDGEGDPDADGLGNHEELELGTDPNLADTDGDGAEDGDDSSPLDPAQSGGSANARTARPELYIGSGLFAMAATFILLGLAKGI